MWASMEDTIDLDVAVWEIERRRDAWRSAGLTVGPVTWRDRGEGWPPVLRTDRTQVGHPDSIGVAVRKGDQEGEVVLYEGGWCDFLYWSGTEIDDAIQDVPGYPGGMTIVEFGTVLDRLAQRFR